MSVIGNKKSDPKIVKVDSRVNATCWKAGQTLRIFEFYPLPFMDMDVKWSTLESYYSINGDWKTKIEFLEDLYIGPIANLTTRWYSWSFYVNVPISALKLLFIVNQYISAGNASSLSLVRPLKYLLTIIVNHFYFISFKCDFQGCIHQHVSCQSDSF